jgi:hypothetical protein
LLPRYRQGARIGINLERLTESVSFRISKTDYAILMKLIEAKGSTITNVFREALHILFALHGMLPEESSQLLLGQFIQDARILQTVKTRSGGE